MCVNCGVNFAEMSFIGFVTQLIFCDIISPQILIAGMPLGRSGDYAYVAY